MHEKKKTKRKLTKKTRTLILSCVIVAELICAAALSYGIYNISWTHIIERRTVAVATDLGGFESEPLSEPIEPALQKAKEGVINEENETVWATETVNIRTGPGTDYESIGVLNKYSSVLKTGDTYNEWSRVSKDGREFYIKSEYLTDELPIVLDGGSKGEYQKFALAHLSDYGWDESEIYPLINLWNRESGWNPSAHNRSSGAHGIPQALPASKMAAYGSDYYTNGNTQILWGLNYIATRYGSPSNAWRHFQSSHWY